MGLLVPCFWQPRIQSVDLSSHIYNAWLASLIARNQAPARAACMISVSRCAVVARSLMD